MNAPEITGGYAAGKRGTAMTAPSIVRLDQKLNPAAEIGDGIGTMPALLPTLQAPRRFEGRGE